MSAALACCSSSSGHRLRDSPVAAGLKNASAVPNAASITTIAQIGDVAEEDQHRQQPVQRARARRRWRPSRGGARAGPPTRRRSARTARAGARCAASTSPTSVGEPMSVTYSASAMKTIRSPSVLALVRQPQEPELAVAEDARIVVHDVGPMDVDELFDAWERAWSGRDPAAFEPLCDEDVHYEDPLTPEPIEGAARSPRTPQRLWTAFPDARMQRTGERATDGPYVAAPVKVLATHRREVAGLAATNRFVIVHAVLYCELREERLLRIRAFFDLYGAAVQLGVLPRPGTMGEKALLMLRGFGLRNAYVRLAAPLPHRRGARPPPSCTRCSTARSR